MKRETFLYKLLKENNYHFWICSCGLTYNFIASVNTYGKIDGVKYILVKNDKWMGELKVLLKSKWKNHYLKQVLFPNIFSVYRLDDPYDNMYIPLRIRLWIMFGFLFIDWKHLRKESKIDKEIEDENKLLKKECLKNKLESKKFFGEI